MKINAISPAFKGFVKIHKSDDKKDYFVNTANILDIEGYKYQLEKECVNRVYYTADDSKGRPMGFDPKRMPINSYYLNSITFKDEDGKKIKIENIHKELENDEEYEQPMGRDFVDAAAKVCAEADKTGEILSIGV